MSSALGTEARSFGIIGVTFGAFHELLILFLFALETYRIVIPMKLVKFNLGQEKEEVFILEGHFSYCYNEAHRNV